MLSRSSNNLVEALRDVGLLTPKQCAQVPQLCAGHATEPQALAKTLVAQGWLTVYQANQLLAGKVKELVVGPYHLLDVLGQGGQSEVYKARHVEQQWHVALKVIRKDVLERRGTTQRFLQEMEAMAQLNHPNIVQFLDADRSFSDLYCAMEFVEGTDLGKYVRLVGPLAVLEASNYIRQAALGLQHAHEHNFVHRDIKPSNLFLLTDPARPTLSSDTIMNGGLPEGPSGGQIKILDWGLAFLRPTRATNGEASAYKPLRVILGTVDFLAPEQAADANAADIRSDIYNLGCTFYYLLTGQPPFPNGTREHKLRQHQEEQPKPLRELNPVVTNELSVVVARMMAKNPQDRYQTPAAVALTLLPFCRELQLQLASKLRLPRKAVASAV